MYTDPYNNFFFKRNLITTIFTTILKGRFHLDFWKSGHLLDIFSYEHLGKVGIIIIKKTLRHTVLRFQVALESDAKMITTSTCTCSDTKMIISSDRSSHHRFSIKKVFLTTSQIHR